MNVSSVDQIYQIYKVVDALGWDGKKDDKFRTLMHSIKVASIYYNDGPTKYLVSKLEEFLSVTNTDKIMFVHIREPREIWKFQEHAKRMIDENTTLKSMLVEMPGNKNGWTNTSDIGVKNWRYDYTFINKPSKDKGKAHALSFFDKNLRQYIED